MVIVLLFQEAATPAGRPLAPAIPAFAIPVAPVVVCVILDSAVFIQTVGVEEAEPAVLLGATIVVLVAVALAHPPVPVIVYVIVAVPAATPVTKPVLLFTVATPVASDIQAPPAFPFDEKVVVPAAQMFCVPLSVPAFGNAVTVTVLVAVTFEHPPVPVTV